MGVALASKRLKKRPVLGPTGSGGNSHQMPVPMGKVAPMEERVSKVTSGIYCNRGSSSVVVPAAALFLMTVRGDVIQKVVGCMSDGMR